MLYRFKVGALALCLSVFCFSGCDKHRRQTPQTPIVTPSSPILLVDFLPPYGSFENLQGHTFNANSKSYGVVVCIKIRDWFTKPSVLNSIAPIADDGKWSCDITTVAGDQFATDIAVFLIPLSYSPPILTGASSIPSELYSHSVDNVILDRGQINQPLNLMAELLPDNNVLLTWEDNSDNEDGFDIERQINGQDWQDLGPVSANSTSFMDENAVDGYLCYRVTAFNPLGKSNPTDGPCLAVGQLPEPPTNLTALATPNGFAKLTWQDNSDNEIYFVISIKRGNDDWREVRNTNANDQEWIDEEIESGILTCYKIFAFNATGRSPETSPICITIGPLSPNNLIATDLHNGQVNLTWQDNSDNELSFIIERKAQGYTWQEIIRVDANIASYIDQNVGEGNWCYRVSAINENRQSNYSQDACLVVVFDFPIIYKLSGLNFGPFIGHQDPNTGTVLSVEQIEDRALLINDYADWLKSYATNEGHQQIGRIGHKYGKKVAMGAWISNDLDANERELNGLRQAMRDGEVDIAVVGNEVILWNRLPVEQLIAYIESIRQEFPGAIITTAEPTQVWLNHPELVIACDLIFANVYPFWDGVAINDAVAALHNQYQQLTSIAQGKTVWISETGWPSGGDPNLDAVPSPENAAFYFLNFVSWARANQVPYFYFEAFDEFWKHYYEPNGVGEHWGIFDQDGKMKPGMQTVFEGQTISDNWTKGPPCGPGQPQIEFTFTPPIGSSENLRGRVCHVPPRDAQVGVYIHLPAFWIIKPYFNKPGTPINPDGSFTTDITTGGIDETADKIAAFVFPIGYQIPTYQGQLLPAELPQELFNNAVTYLIIDRTAP